MCCFRTVFKKEAFRITSNEYRAVNRAQLPIVCRIAPEVGLLKLCPLAWNFGSRFACSEL
jgi:hypothetical protein